MFLASRTKDSFSHRTLASLLFLALLGFESASAGAQTKPAVDQAAPAPSSAAGQAAPPAAPPVPPAPDQTVPPTSSVAGQAAPAVAATAAQYAGAEVCKTCHEDIYKNFERSQHHFGPPVLVLICGQVGDPAESLAAKWDTASGRLSTSTRAN